MGRCTARCWDGSGPRRWWCALVFGVENCCSGNMQGLFTCVTCYTIFCTGSGGFLGQLGIAVDQSKRHEQVSELSHFPLTWQRLGTYKAAYIDIGGKVVAEAHLWTQHIVKPGWQVTHANVHVFLLGQEGVTGEDRLNLGYQSNKMSSISVWSWCSCQAICIVVTCFEGKLWRSFEPNNTRSGRRKPGAESLDKVESNPFLPRRISENVYKARWCCWFWFRKMEDMFQVEGQLTECWTWTWKNCRSVHGFMFFCRAVEWCSRGRHVETFWEKRCTCLRREVVSLVERRNPFCNCDLCLFSSSDVWNVWNDRHVWMWNCFSLALIELLQMKLGNFLLEQNV